jgi:hypothetical protein
VVFCDAELERRLWLRLFHCARSIQNQRTHVEALNFSETVRDRFVKLNGVIITEIALTLQRRTNHAMASDDLKKFTAYFCGIYE